MSSGCVVGTISTTIWLPVCCSTAASFCDKASRCAELNVAVWSITRPLSGGTGSTYCATATAGAKTSHASSAHHETRVRAACIAVLLRCGLVEAHRRLRRDLRLVLHR